MCHHSWIRMVLYTGGGPSRLRVALAALGGSELPVKGSIQVEAGRLIILSEYSLSTLCSCPIQTVTGESRDRLNSLAALTPHRGLTWAGSSVEVAGAKRRSLREGLGVGQACGSRALGKPLPDTGPRPRVEGLRSWGCGRAAKGSQTASDRAAGR